MRLKTLRPLYLQILFVGLSFGIMVFASYSFLSKIEREHLEEQTEDIFSNVGLHLSYNLKELESILGIVSENMHKMLLHGVSLEEAETFIKEATEYARKEAKITGLLNFTGWFETFGDSGAAYNPNFDNPNSEFRGSPDWIAHERPWYKAAIAANGNVAVTDVYIDVATKDAIFTYARAIFDQNGKRLAIISVDVSINRIHEYSSAQNKENISWILLDRNQIILAHPNKDFLGKRFRDVGSNIIHCVDEFEKNEVLSHCTGTDYTSRKMFFSVRPLENGWFLGVRAYPENYYANLKSIVLFLVILGSVMAVGLSIVLIRINAKKDKAELQISALSVLNNVLNGVDAMICVTDPETDAILFMNDEMRHVFGVSSNCAGQLCYKALRNLDARCNFCPCNQLDKDPSKEIIWEQSHTGNERIYRSYSKYIKWPNGKTVHIQHAVDITDIKEAELKIAEQNEQLKAAFYKAESANKAKSTFLANTSHEIRTPMNTILGIAEMQLQRENLSPETEDAFDRIYESGSLLLSIINDILDLSKIEAGKLELVPVKYNVPNLISEVITINRLPCESKPIEFKLNIDENTPVEMVGDELCIKQILNNLLSNAFKYTEKGSVNLSVSTEPINNHLPLATSHSPENNATIIFKVTDTGQGMNAEHVSKLFSEYTRFNVEANRTTVGIGLGLNITKHLVDKMNGVILVESEPGKGTVFTVHIPQERVSSDVCGPELSEKLLSPIFKSASIKKKTEFLRKYMPYGSVLIVDDVASNLYVAKGMLQPYGLKIETASSGFEAIEKVKQGKTYDIIFMDHMMPKMDGIEATKILREIGYKKPIVAFTANAIAGQSEIFLQKGFDGCIFKPIDSRELNAILNEMVREKRP